MQQISVPGFEGRDVSVELGSGFGKPRLFVDGAPAQAGPKKGQFALRCNDGTTVEALFKGGFPDPVPSLEVGGHRVRLAPPLSPFQWFWAGFPIVLTLLGGAIGGGLGFAALAINAQLMRSSLPPALRYAASAGVTAVAFALWLGVVKLIRG